MRENPILSVGKLKIGLLDPGHFLNREGLDSCQQKYSALEVWNEASFVSLLREQALTPEVLLSWGENFESFKTIQGVHLLLLTFSSKGSLWLRTVNFLSQRVSTVLMDVPSPSCTQILQSENFFVVESHPDLADVSVNGRKIGEAPVWTSLPKGTYEISCSLPREVFRPQNISLPEQTQILCQRENQNSLATNADKEDTITPADEVTSVLTYLIGGLGSLAAIVIPILLLL